MRKQLQYFGQMWGEPSTPGALTVHMAPDHSNRPFCGARVKLGPLPRDSRSRVYTPKGARLDPGPGSRLGDTKAVITVCRRCLRLAEACEPCQEEAS